MNKESIVVEFVRTGDNIEVVSAKIVPIVEQRMPTGFVTLDMFLEEEGIKEEVTEVAKAKVRKLRGPRKPPVNITSQLVQTTKFLMESGKTKEEVSELTSASVSTIIRIIGGYYDDRK
jgi:hypothetical protein